VASAPRAPTMFLAHAALVPAAKPRGPPPASQASCLTQDHGCPCSGMRDSTRHTRHDQGDKMKKILVLCGVLALVSGIAWQLSTGSPARLSSAGSSSIAIENGNPSPIPVQEPPPCPDTETCQDSGCPHTTNSCNNVDTGLSSCTQSDGTILSCNGSQTIHQKACRCGTIGPCFQIRDAEPVFCQ
jgi:hypothetical protein